MRACKPVWLLVTAALLGGLLLAACRPAGTPGNAQANADYTSSRVTSDPPIRGTEIIAATASGSGLASATTTQTASGCRASTSSGSTRAAATSTGRLVSGIVPSPPLGQQLAAGLVTFGPPTQGTASTSHGTGAAVPALPLLGQPAIRLYESSCSGAELIAYYTETLTGEGWTGSFVKPTASPFSSFSMTTTNTSVSAGSAPSGALPRPLAGSFVGATNDGLVVALIELRPVQATSASSAMSAGPTYVQIILQAIPYVGAVQGS